jgi:exo-1,4-beta-D-glucosaminidase
MPQATMTQYANLKALHTLRTARLSVTAHTHRASGLGGTNTVTDVTIKNTSSARTVAFFLRANLRRGNASGVPASGDNEVRPVFWSDNDITLWPGESETLHVYYRSADLHGRSPVITVSGWNVAGAHVKG